MSVLFLILAMLIQPTTATTAATTSTSTTGPVDVEQLIAQLSSEVWRERQEAQDQLSSMGDGIRRQLERALGEATADEPRQMIQTILSRLDEQRRLGASIITIHMDNVAPNEAFAELSKQSGSELRTMPENLWQVAAFERISVHIDSQPFWTAAQELCEKAGVALSPWNNELRLMQGQGMKLMNGPHFVSGPFLVRLVSASRNNTIDFTRAVGSRSVFQINGQVIAEPKIRVGRGGYTARLEAAIDDLGQSLLPNAAPRNVAMAAVPNGMWNFNVMLIPPENLGDRISVLRGIIDVSVVVRTQTFEIVDPESRSGSETTIGNLTIRLETLQKKGPNEFELRLTIRSEGQALDGQNLQQSLAQLRLIDGKGVRYLPRETSVGGTPEKSEARLTLFPEAIRERNAAVDQLARLVWPIAIETRELEIPFEFKDLAIPK